MGFPEALSAADNQSLNRTRAKERPSLNGRDPLRLCLLQGEGDRMTVWVKVNVSVRAWLEFMRLQMSEPVSKHQGTVLCGCVMWVRLVSACSFPVPHCIDTVHTFHVSTVHYRVQYWITFVFATFWMQILNNRSS